MLIGNLLRHSALLRFAAVLGLLWGAAAQTTALADTRAGVFTVNKLSTTELAPGAWAVYLELKNTTKENVLITGVDSPDFNNADLVLRTRDRFQRQTAVLFSANEKAQFRSGGTHILLTNPVSATDQVQVTLNTASGQQSTFRFSLQGLPAATSRSQSSQPDNGQPGMVSPPEEKSSGRVISHNPMRR